MKLFKLIVHQKDFSGWYPNIHVLQFFSRDAFRLLFAVCSVKTIAAC
jgi:hypothetical protein